MLRLGLAGYQPLVLYIGAIAAFLLSIVWKPELGLYYLVPLLPMQTARYWLHNYPFGEKLVDVLMLGVLIGLYVHRKRPIFLPSAVNKWIAGFCLLMYLSLWKGASYLGVDLPLSIEDPRFSDWKNYVEMLLLVFVVAATIRTKKQMTILLALMCLSMLMVNRAYHSNISGRDFSSFSYELRDAGPLGFAGENGMGAFQAEFLVFLIGLAAYSKKLLVTIGIWFVAFTSIYSLLFSFSRGAYVGFMLGFLTVGLVKNRKLLIVFVVILIGWQGIVPNAVRERVMMTYQNGQGLDSSAEDRVTIWEDAMKVIDHDPVFGTGFDTYRSMARIGNYGDTHNYYLKVALEMGVIGLLLFLALLFAAGKMAWRLLRHATDPLLQAIGCGFFAMWVTTLIVNFFGDRWTFLQVNGFFCVLLGVVARGLVATEDTRPTLMTGSEEVGLTSPPAVGVYP
jgi:O-antigen ligase